MNISFKVGDIIEESTEGLICSGNIQLNMSGGVNGALLQAGGNQMQVDLHEYLQKHNKRFVEPGFVMRIGPKPFHFKSIVYTVAVDGFYETSIELVETSLTNALVLLAEDGCNTVAVPAIGTGYGYLSKEDFGESLQLCIKKSDWPFSEMHIVLRNKTDLDKVEKSYNNSV